jgi:hypothetical protein
MADLADAARRCTRGGWMLWEPFRLSCPVRFGKEKIDPIAGKSIRRRRAVGRRKKAGD